MRNLENSEEKSVRLFGILVVYWEGTAEVKNLEKSEEKRRLRFFGILVVYWEVKSQGEEFGKVGASPSMRPPA